jgi:hypothetical protein
VFSICTKIAHGARKVGQYYQFMFSRSILVSCKCILKLLANKGTMRGCKGTFVDVETWDGILWTRELAQARQTIPWRELTPCQVRIMQTLHQFRKIQANVHKHSAFDPKQTRAIWWFSILSKHMEIVTSHGWALQTPWSPANRLPQMPEASAQVVFLFSS